MGKNIAGLHKQVSSIFDGVPLTRNEGLEQAVFRPGPGPSGNIRIESFSNAPQTNFNPQPVKNQTYMPDFAVNDFDAHVVPLKPSHSAQPSFWKRIANIFFPPHSPYSNARQKKMVILIPVLIGILVFVNIRKSASSKPIPPKPQTRQTVARYDVNPKINWQIPETYPVGIRNPMQLAVLASIKQDFAKPIVNGIVFNETNPSAIVGSQIVHVNETVAGATITKINKDSVEFEADGKNWIQKVER